MGLIYKRPRLKRVHRTKPYELKLKAARMKATENAARREARKAARVAARPAELVRNVQLEGIQGFVGIRDVAEVQEAVRQAVHEAMTEAIRKAQEDGILPADFEKQCIEARKALEVNPDRLI